MATTMSDYRCPAAHTAEDTRTGWLREVVETSQAYLKAQRGYPDIDHALDIMASLDTGTEKLPKYLSRVKVNRLKRQVREVVAALSALRLSGAYRSDNREYEKNEGVLNRLAKAWWYNTSVDRAIRGTLQWAAVGGVGYLSPIYERNYWTTGRGDVALHVYGPRDVLPFQIGRDHDLQRAYAVTISTEVPLAQAHALYPEYADRIVADRTAPGWVGRAIKRARNAVANVFTITPRATGEETNIPIPVVDVYDTYILDQSINLGPNPVPMGRPGTSWFYEVPVLGSDLPTGYFDQQGNPLIRKATPEDAQLYPLRRRMTMVSNHLVYDGTSEWWHGKVPLVKFTLDDWIWDFLGTSLVRDNESLQESETNVLRATEQRIQLGLNPPSQYDQSVIAKSLVERLDLRKSGQMIPANFMMGDGIKPVLTPDYYHVNPEVFQYIEKLEALMDHQMGVPDFSAFARARQIPAGDTLEKMLELLGPLVGDMARNMDCAIRDTLEMVKPLFFQFYTTPRRLEILGPDGLVEEDYDYDPGNMVPSHLPGEDVGSKSRYTMLERARWHANNFIYRVVPTSHHQITQLSNKLVHLQLYRAGFPLDPWTMAETMDIANFGAPPQGANTVMERWIAWMRMRVEFQELLGVQMETGRPQGRPPSGQAAPQLRQKEGGTRSSVVESK